MSDISNKNSRKRNSIYNFITGMGGQMLVLLLSFVSRSVFIKTLGSEYLGISGLFSNILSLLSLAEFGVGHAILYKMYEPLATGDEERLASLTEFYKKVYRMIGLAVALVGICLIPFLPLLIEDYGRLSDLGINAPFIFCLYLLNSVSTYLFFAYKSGIIKADQREYVLNIVGLVTSLLQCIAQIFVLIVFENFVLFVVIMIICVILQNIIGAVIADRDYPFIRKKSEQKVDEKEIKELLKDCSALFLYRLNGVILKSTDNIVLSVVMGLHAVAKYSNYYVFYTSINTIYSKVFSSVAHSVGNLHTSNDKEREYLIFKVLNLIAAILGGTSLVGLFVVSDDFVKVWIGKDWIIKGTFAFFLGMEVYTLSIRLLLTKYRNAMGLFQQAKYRPVFSVIVNLAVSVLLVYQMGIVGVVIGTVVADWTTFMVFDPRIIHKYGFENRFSVVSYYVKVFYHLAIAVVSGGILKYICSSLFEGHGWFTVIINTGIVGISVPLLYLILNSKTDEYQYLKNNIISKITRKL